MSWLFVRVVLASLSLCVVAFMVQPLQQQQAAAVAPAIERSKGEIAVLLMADEEGIVSTQLTVIKARDENDNNKDKKIEVFICHDLSKGNKVCGSFYSEDLHLFDIKGDLKSATLNPIDVDVCTFADLADNGKCDAMIGQLTLEADWTGIGEITRTNDSKFRCSVGDDFRMTVDTSSKARESETTLKVNGDQVKAISFEARMAEFSELVMRFGEPPVGNDCS
jgi:hypothetical protein